MINFDRFLDAIVAASIVLLCMAVSALFTLMIMEKLCL